MAISLAQSDLRTHYIRDPFAIETIDVDQIVQELAEAARQHTQHLGGAYAAHRIRPCRARQRPAQRTLPRA